jgi:hypothetical protein
LPGPNWTNAIGRRSRPSKVQPGLRHVLPPSGDDQTAKAFLGQGSSCRLVIAYRVRPTDRSEAILPLRLPAAPQPVVRRPPVVLARTAVPYET